MAVGAVASNFYVKQVAQVNTEITNHQEHAHAITIFYQEAGTSHDPAASSLEPGSITLTLLENTDDFIIPGSVLFEFGGVMYFDRDGVVYKDFDSATGAGTAVGSIDYSGRTVTLETWTPGAAPGVVIHACATAATSTMTSAVAGRAPGSPIRPESFSISITDAEGNVISATADTDGVLSGTNISGLLNYETGVYDLWFTSDNTDDTGASDVPVVLDSGIFNAVLYSFLPLDAELIGLDPVRLPSDGRVPIFREGDVIVLSHTAETTDASPAAGAQVALARDHLAGVEIFGANGYVLASDQYTVNRLTGVVTYANPLTLEDGSGNVLTTPLTIKDRVEHMSVANDVQITGEISFISPTGHDFPADETVVSSAKVWGDINSRYYNFFTQKTWYGDYLDDRVGDDTNANYNDVDNPIEIANNGAITEKWVLKFTSSTGFDVIGETLGNIASGNTSVDLAPINPNTGNPYFVMRSAGFGAGWATGNCIRFDTDGCLAPVWIARTVLSGAAQEDDDQFVFQIRGDAD